MMVLLPLVLQFHLLIAFFIISSAHSLSKPITQTKSTMAPIQKTIKEICRRPPAHWVGDGFKVFPVFADKAFTAELSPFLMFDYAAPKAFEPNASDKRRGVGMHPHRGFETVTVG